MDEVTRGQTLQTGIPKELRKQRSSPDVVVSRPNPLESEAYQNRLRKLMQWRRQARIAQADNRAEMATDEDFYDGIQLDERDLRILQDRNQPTTVFNVIANTVNWILGTERRAGLTRVSCPAKRRGGISKSQD
jgi:hypothetical protein